jgi:hypothetical protein
LITSRFTTEDTEFAERKTFNHEVRKSSIPENSCPFVVNPLKKMESGNHETRRFESGIEEKGIPR